MAAISLIPSSELLLLSADFVDRRGASVDKSLPFTEAVGFLMPDWWGRPTQTPFRPIMLERAVYVGALPLMLAVAAIVLRPTVTRIAVALFGGLWLAVVLGIPPLTQIVTRLPVFSSGQLIVFSFLALALLAGWGLDDFSSTRQASRARRRLLFAGLGALLLLPLILVIVVTPGALAVPRAGFEVAWLLVDPPGRFRDPQGLDVVGPRL